MREARQEKERELMRSALDIPDLTPSEREFLADVNERLTDDTRIDKQRFLSMRQIVVVREIMDRHVPQYENLVSQGRVPIGKPVPTPAVLLNLPKRPPVRRVT